MRLAELQALFYEAVVGDDGTCARALEQRCTDSLERPARVRVGIYAGMYRARLVDALRADFPKLARLVGESEFATLAAGYARQHPSEHYDISRIGRRFASFLSAHPETNSREDAADLAALEWARAEVFVESNDAPLEHAAWIALLSQDPSVTRICTVRALRVLRLQHDVVPVFRSLDAESAPVAPRAEPTALVVWRARSGHQVFHAVLTTQEACALELATLGATLADICGAFAESEDPVQAAFAAFSSWGEEGFVASSSR